MTETKEMTEAEKVLSNICPDLPALMDKWAAFMAKQAGESEPENWRDQPIDTDLGSTIEFMEIIRAYGDDRIARFKSENGLS